MESVEKEDAREEERHINPGAVRRNLFVDEPAPEPIDKLASDDNQEDVLEVQEEASDSEELAGEEEVVRRPVPGPLLGPDPGHAHRPARGGAPGPALRPARGPTLGPQYIGKYGTTTWDIHCPQRNRQTRIPARNIVRHLPGVRPQIKPNSPMEAWLLLITDGILDAVVRFTNQRIEKV